MSETSVSNLGAVAYAGKWKEAYKKPLYETSEPMLPGISDYEYRSWNQGILRKHAVLCCGEVILIFRTEREARAYVEMHNRLSLGSIVGRTISGLQKTHEAKRQDGLSRKGKTVKQME